MPTYTALRPTVASLQSGQHQFHDFIAAIYDLLISQGDDAAESASKVYLAVILAFQRAGLLEISHAPNIWLSGQAGHEFEVSHLKKAT
jgi:hypothetical protein